MSTILLTCPICGSEYHKSRSEYNRNQRKARPSYCSLFCTGKANIKNIPEDKRLRPQNLNPSNRLDELSPFRYHYRNIKRRKNRCSLTLQDLKDQWDKQKGICPYTGWLLKNMPTTNYRDQLPRTPDRASLDRIDSSKPYEVGNVQFVSMIAQYAKNAWHEDELIRFCEAVSSNNAFVSA